MKVFLVLTTQVRETSCVFHPRWERLECTSPIDEEHCLRSSTFLLITRVNTVVSIQLSGGMQRSLRSTSPNWSSLTSKQHQRILSEVSNNMVQQIGVLTCVPRSFISLEGGITDTLIVNNLI